MSLPRPRVIVVEPDAARWSALAQACGSTFDLTRADGAHEALAAGAGAQVAMVALIRTAGFDGFAVVRELKARGVAVIATHPDAARLSDAELLGSGARAFFGQPYRYADLELTVFRLAHG
jgi:CheY-like chemotaxis protein